MSQIHSLILKSAFYAEVGDSVFFSLAAGLIFNSVDEEGLCAEGFD